MQLHADKTLQQWIWDWSMMINYALQPPMGYSTAVEITPSHFVIEIMQSTIAKWQGSPSHRPLGTLPCAFERGILASIPHERCPALASINQLMVVLAYCSLWFQDSRLHNSNSNIGTNNKTAKPPVIQRIVFRSFSHSTAILCDLYTNFTQACIPCIPPSKNVQYLCLTADHLQSCTQWHNECLQETQGAGLLNWWGFIFIHILQTSEEATAPNHSMKTPCDGKHQKVHLYRSIPIICAYMYSTYVHTYAYVIIYVSVKTFVFDSIQYPLKYETTPTYATYVIHLSHRSINDWGQSHGNCCYQEANMPPLGEYSLWIQLSNLSKPQGTMSQPISVLDLIALPRSKLSSCLQKPCFVLANTWYMQRSAQRQQNTHTHTDIASESSFHVYFKYIFW